MVQDNQRAGLALMECGVIPRPAAAGSGDAVEGDEPSPPNILVSNRSCSSGSSCTKSESMAHHSSKAGDNTIVVNYNDHDGSGYSGVSYSTDGGSLPAWMRAEAVSTSGRTSCTALLMAATPGPPSP
jgi:hypothetical protein